jgi:hypothetical protein
MHGWLNHARSSARGLPLSCGAKSGSRSRVVLIQRRQDSNLRIRNLCPAGFTAVVPCGEGRSCTLLKSGRTNDLKSNIQVSLWRQGNSG